MQDYKKAFINDMLKKLVHNIPILWYLTSIVVFFAGFLVILTLTNYKELYADT